LFITSAMNVDVWWRVGWRKERFSIDTAEPPIFVTLILPFTATTRARGEKCPHYTY
jgi:hypothetical protein